MFLDAISRCIGLWVLEVMFQRTCMYVSSIRKPRAPFEFARQNNRRVCLLLHWKFALAFYTNPPLRLSRGECHSNIYTPETGSRYICSSGFSLQVLHKDWWCLRFWKWKGNEWGVFWSGLYIFTGLLHKDRCASLCYRKTHEDKCSVLHPHLSSSWHFHSDSAYGRLEKERSLVLVSAWDRPLGLFSRAAEVHRRTRRGGKDNESAWPGLTTIIQLPPCLFLSLERFLSMLSWHRKLLRARSWAKQSAVCAVSASRVQEKTL